MSATDEERAGLDRARRAVAGAVTVDPPLGPCRGCGQSSWGRDQKGPVHACCALADPDRPCPACAASRKLNAQQAGRRRAA